MEQAEQMNPITAGILQGVAIFIVTSILAFIGKAVINQAHGRPIAAKPVSKSGRTVYNFFYTGVTIIVVVITPSPIDDAQLLQKALAGSAAIGASTVLVGSSSKKREEEELEARIDRFEYDGKWDGYEYNRRD